MPNLVPGPRSLVSCPPAPRPAARLSLVYRVPVRYPGQTVTHVTRFYGISGGSGNETSPA